MSATFAGTFRRHAASWAVAVLGTGALWFAPAGAQDKPAKAAPRETKPEPKSAKPVKAGTNLNFELGDRKDGVPEGWGGGGETYERTSDTQEPHGGKHCGRIRHTGKDASDMPDFASFTQNIPAAELRGQRVRYSGFLRTDKVESGFAGLWMRVDGKDENARGLTFDNMAERAPHGTTGWKEYAVVLDVPAEAEKIHFGALLSGNGTMWVDDLKLEIVGKDVPATDARKKEPN